jgi:hypothetical protein
MNSRAETGIRLLTACSLGLLGAGIHHDPAQCGSCLSNLVSDKNLLNGNSGRDSFLFSVTM